MMEFGTSESFVTNPELHPFSPQTSSVHMHVLTLILPYMR